MAKSAQQPVKPIPTRAGLVAEMQPLATAPKPCCELDHNVSVQRDSKVGRLATRRMAGLAGFRMGVAQG